MTGDPQAPRCGEDVAPYALGALPDEDARTFERHLRECELCQGDLDTLRPAVDALPLSVEEVEPPAELRRRIMSEVEADARRRRAAARDARERRFSFRPLPALAAACTVLVVGIAIGTGLTADDEPRRIPGQTSVAGATAAVEMDESGGTLVVRGMPRPPAGRVYQMWLRRDDGTLEPTDALFEVRGGHAEVAVPDELDGVEQVLVTHERHGGAAQPTRDPSVVVSL